MESLEPRFNSTHLGVSLLRNFNAGTSSEEFLSGTTSSQPLRKNIKASSLRVESEDLPFNSIERLSLESKSNFVTLPESTKETENPMKPSLGLVTPSLNSVIISKRVAS